MSESRIQAAASINKSRVTPKNGIRKNHAARVPMILPIVAILPIFPSTFPHVSRLCIRIFVTIGESIPKRKLAGLKRMIASKIAEIRISDMKELMRSSTKSFVKISMKIQRALARKIFEISSKLARVSERVPPT